MKLRLQRPVRVGMDVATPARALTLAVMLSLAACATTPDPIADTADGAPLDQVAAAPQDHEGELVRWGGTIAAVENAAESTRVFVVARALTEGGRPHRGDASAGRFIAVLSGFHDPVVFARGRAITVVGTVQGTESARVGAYEYRYVRVAAERHRLWPKPDRYTRYPYPPFYRDPWRDPWYPHPYLWPRPYRYR